ncbi:unnamed protein product [Rangifer tarandus platyrhynchus]|uniref:Uncharacterized protein n=1 Tax=Rangifer tarandus platyrhynchus TaxID=3082113 RepID=A0AC59Y9G3_RANTA
MQHSVAMAAARCCPPLPRWQKPSVAFPPSEQRSQGSLGQGDPRLESHSTPKQAPPPKPASLQPAAHRHCGRPPSAGAGRAPARTPPPPQIQDFSCGPRIRESRKGRGSCPLLASSLWRLRVAFSLLSGLQHPTRPHHLCLPSDQAPGSSQTHPQHSTSSSARGHPHTPASTRPAPTCSVLLPDV